MADTLFDKAGKDYRFHHVLDAGCGTGLCGRFIKPYTEKLTGVDIAGPMLDIARPLKMYDELVEADLIEYLGDQQETFDAIISVDTFNYFGELNELLAACAASLQSGGHLVFTLEYADKNFGDYKLMPHGRFQHQRDYIERSIKDNDLALTSITPFVLRKENGQDVNGWAIHSSKV